MLHQLQPLDPSQHYIRLVKVLPRKEDGSLCLELHESVLLENGSYPSYKALSYEWGSPRLYDRPIFVNGRAVHIRCNLYYFLRDLVKYHRITHTFLWVDSLCVDQANTREKNHQVQHMSDTFAKATEVLAWIGPPDEASKTIFNQINASGRLDDKNSETVLQICSRTYWSRMWIIQEICLAKQLWIICGSSAVSWPAWRTAIFDFHEIDGPLELDFGDRALDTPAGIVMVFRQFFQQSLLRDNLVEYVQLFRHFQCSQKHDKIYALLGLIPDPSILLVDYDRSLEELLLSLLASESREQGLPPLDILAESLHISLNKFQLSLVQALRFTVPDLVPAMSSQPTIRSSLNYRREEIASFLQSPFQCYLSTRSCHRQGTISKLPIEMIECLDAQTVFCCSCMLCQTPETGDVSPFSQNPARITKAKLKSCHAYVLTNERVVLLYQHNQYIATYALSSSLLTASNTDQIDSKEAPPFCILFHDPYIASWSRMHPGDLDPTSGSLVLPYFSVTNLIMHRAKSLDELTRLSPNTHYLGNVTWKSWRDARREAKEKEDKRLIHEAVERKMLADAREDSSMPRPTTFTHGTSGPDDRDDDGWEDIVESSAQT